MAISVEPLVADRGHRSLEIVFTEDPSTVHLAGELDLGSAQLLSDTLVELEAEKATPLILDLSGLTFLDCSGLSVLVGAYNRARRYDRELVVTNPQKSVRRILLLTDCSYLLGDPDRETLEA